MKFFKYFFFLLLSILFPVYLSANPVFTKGATTVLVIDVSGSMTGTDPDRRAIESAMLFVDLLSEGDEVGLVFFHHGIASRSGLFTIGKDQESSKKPIKEVINRQGYGGGTEIILGLSEGLRMINSSKFLNQIDRNFSLVLMTDGVDTNPAKDYANMKIEAMQRNVEIHPIAFGSGANDGIPKLKLLTSKELLVVLKPEELPSRFATIFGRIHDVYIRNFTDSAGSFNFKIHPLAIETSLILSNKLEDTSKAFTLADPSGKNYDKNEIGTAYFASGREYKCGKLNGVSPGDSWKLSANFKPTAGLFFQIPDLEFAYNWGSFDLNNPDIKALNVAIHRKSSKEQYKEPNFYKESKIFLVLEGINGDFEKLLLTDDGKDYDTIANDFKFAGRMGLYKQGLFQYYLTLEHPDFTISSNRYAVALEPLVTFSFLQPLDQISIKQGEKFQINFEPDQNTGFAKNSEIVQIKWFPKGDGSELIPPAPNMFFSEEHKKDSVAIGTKLGHPWMLFFDGTPAGKYEGELEFQYMNSNSVKVPYSFEVIPLSWFERLFYLFTFIFLITIAIWIWRKVSNANPFPRQFFVYSVGSDFTKSYFFQNPRVFTNWFRKETTYNAGDSLIQSKNLSNVTVYDTTKPEDKRDFSADSHYIFKPPSELYFFDTERMTDETAKQLQRELKKLKEQSSSSSTNRIIVRKINKRN